MRRTSRYSREPSVDPMAARRDDTERSWQSLVALSGTSIAPRRNQPHCLTSHWGNHFYRVARLQLLRCLSKCGGDAGRSQVGTADAIGLGLENFWLRYLQKNRACDQYWLEMIISIPISARRVTASVRGGTREINRSRERYGRIMCAVRRWV